MTAISRPLLLVTLTYLSLPRIDSCKAPDLDGDGWTVEAGDCDDASDTTYPDAPEACDRIDNDCDGSIDDGAPCLDQCTLTGDWLEPDGTTLNLVEDTLGTVDGYAYSEGITYSMVEGTHAPGVSPSIDLYLGCITEGCGSILRVIGDFGNTCDQIVSSRDTGPVIAIRMTPDGDADGWALEEGDCNDADSSVHPMAIEYCNGIDEDCDGSSDEGCAASVCSLTGTWVGGGYTWRLTAPPEGGTVTGTISDAGCEYTIYSSYYHPNDTPPIHLTAYSESCNWGLAVDGTFGEDCDHITTEWGWVLIRG